MSMDELVLELLPAEIDNVAMSRCCTTSCDSNNTDNTTQTTEAAGGFD